jgi:serine/threonine protein kinase
MDSAPDGEDRRPSPPVLAGRYRIIRTLTSADTGATFIVFDVRLRRWRTMDIPWPGQRTATKRLIAQAEKLARLEHPAVERVVDLGADGAVAFVVRDRLHGSLAEHLESRGALTPALAVATVVRIADGLEHAHSVGLLHGQIRPRLVRFADDAGVVLTGFGEVRVVDATTAGRVAEPWAHLAPEQRVEWNPDEAGDVYALGALLTTLILGRYNADLFRASASDKEMAPIPEVLRPIVLRACTRDPAARFRSVTEFRVALEAAASGLGTPESPPPWHLDIESLPSSSADGVTPDAGVKELVRVITKATAEPRPNSRAEAPGRTGDPPTKTPIPYTMQRQPDTSQPRAPDRRGPSTVPPASERTDPITNVKVFGLNTGKRDTAPPPPPKRELERMMKGIGVVTAVLAVFALFGLLWWLATAESRADTAFTEAIEFERVTAETLARYAGDRKTVEAAWFAFNDAAADEKPRAAAAFARVAIEVRDGVQTPLPADVAAAIDRMAAALDTWETRHD